MLDDDIVEDESIEEEILVTCALCTKKLEIAKAEIIERYGSDIYSCYPCRRKTERRRRVNG